MNEVAHRSVLALQAGTSAAVLAAAALAVVLLVVLGVRSTWTLQRGRRAVLVSLRVVLALLIVVLALRPMISRESLAVSSTPVAVIVDTSASMEVRDGSGGTRIGAVATWMQRNARLLDRLEGGALVDWFAASDGVVRSTSRQEITSGRLTPAGGTDLLGSLRQVAERYPAGRRPAVLLISDGADHGELGRLVRAREPLDRVVPPGPPIIAFAPEAGGFSDVAVDLVARDPVGFLRTAVTMRVRVRSTGLPAADVPVTLLRGDDVLSVKTVHVGGDGPASADVTFTVEPTRVGESLYRVQAPITAGEAVTTNNEVPFSVRVVRDRIRVLQVVGRPSWDGRFLRELLKRDPAIDLISFFILRNSYDDPNATVEDLSLIPFPVDELFEEKLRGFDLVLFQNFEFSPYGIQLHLGELRKQVEERGGGLAIVGGDLSLGDDYRHPDIAAVLPVQSTAGGGWVADTFGVVPTAVGERHPILRLGGEEGVTAAFADLLPVTGLNVGIVPAAGAHVLLESRTSPRRPVLVAGEMGAGRVVVLATDGTWRWSLPMAGRGKTTRAYERFWQNVIRWLVRDPSSALLVLDADRRTGGPGEPFEIRARAANESYEAEADVPVTFQTRDAGGAQVRQDVVNTDADGVARLSFEPQRPGYYSVTAKCARGEAGPVFLERVDPGGELQDAAVDEAVLRALTSATGGSVHGLAERDVDVPFADQRQVRVESVKVVPLWRTWPAWGLVAGLMCFEWWLRRRWGLA